MKKIKFISGTLIISAAILFQSCHSSHATENDDDQKQFCMSDSLHKSVSFDTVRFESVISELTLSGKITVNEDKQVRVYPLASGHVTEVKVSLGDFVHEGQVLAVIRSSDLANYFNEYNSAKSDLEIAKKSLDVNEDMYKSGLSSETEHITAQKNYQKALSEFNKISEVLKIYGNTPKEDMVNGGSGYVIKSPISGFIVEKKVSEGSEVRPDDGSNLFTVSDLKEVWAMANLYETDIAKMQPGYDAEVTTLSYGDKVFKGKIDNVSNVLNPDTKVLNLKIKLQNPDYLLKPGMFARIKVRHPDNKNMLSVPSASVIFDDNKNYVVRYQDKCKIQMQNVNVIKTLNGRSYIEDGDLKEKDLIITRGGLFIFTALKKL